MLLASIDIGTNSTRYLLAEVAGQQIFTVKCGLITTRLGQGINQGKLLPEAMERTVSALEQFLQELANYQPVRVVVAATSAVRDAQNGAEFLELTRQRTGLDVVVLSGEEEAQASYRGVLAGLPITKQSTLVLDVGGGSTEIIWPVGQGVRYKSLPVGAVRMTEGGRTKEEIKARMAETLEEVYTQVKRGSELVAVGGTATTLAAIALHLERYQPELVHGAFLSTVEIEQILKRLQAAGVEGRKKIIGLQPERADIILAGGMIIQLVLEGLQLKGLTVSETDILQGLVMELAQDMSK